MMANNHTVCLENNPIILYNPRMPFPERIRQIEIEKAEKCGVCDDPFLPNDEIEVHSVTSLHLVYKNGRYVITHIHQKSQKKVTEFVYM
jgi:hypothetical protein